MVDALYKKLELYLYNLFQTARLLEEIIKYNRIDRPTIFQIIDPHGCDDSRVRIPINPFVLKDDDWEFFNLIFEEYQFNSDSSKELRSLQRETWKRIKEIKAWLGITKFTRFVGERDADKRLVNEIDFFLRYPESVSATHRIVLGDVPDDDENYDEFEKEMRHFQNFLLDREQIKFKKSLKHYIRD